MEELEYDVGLSFAGEQRDYVRRVAEDLKYRGLRVFYDENEEDRLWGKNLLDHLSELYFKRCRYCILFASADYRAKMWPNLERQSAQARDITAAGEYILPVRFDDTEIPGLFPTIYYQDARKKSPEQIAGLFAQKIGQATPARIEFALLSNGAQFDPLTLKMPGYNKMWPQERASLLTTVKVAFDAGREAIRRADNRGEGLRRKFGGRILRVVHGLGNQRHSRGPARPASGEEGLRKFSVDGRPIRLRRSWDLYGFVVLEPRSSCYDLDGSLPAEGCVVTLGTPWIFHAWPQA